MRKLSILAIALILCAFLVLPVNADHYLGLNPATSLSLGSNPTDTVISFHYGYYNSVVGYFAQQSTLFAAVNDGSVAAPAYGPVDTLNDAPLLKLYLNPYQSGLNTFDIYHFDTNNVPSYLYTVSYTIDNNYTAPFNNAYLTKTVIDQTDSTISYDVQAAPDTYLYSPIGYNPINFQTECTLTASETTRTFVLGENGINVYCLAYNANTGQKAQLQIYLEGRGNYTPPTPTPTPTTTPTTTPTGQPTTQPTTQPPRDEDITTSGDFDLWLATSNNLDDSAPAFKLGEFTSSFIEGERVYFEIQNFDYVAQVYGVATVDFEFLDYDTYESVYPTQRFKFNWSENGQWQYKSDDSPTIYNIGENNAETWRIVSSCKGNYLELPSGKYRLKVNLRYGGGNIGVYSPNLISTAFYTDIGVRESGQSTKVTFTIENIDFDTGTQLTGANVTVYEYLEFNNQLNPIYQNSNAPAKIQILVPSQSMLFIEYNKYGYEDVNAVIFDYLDNRKGQLISAALLSSRLYYTRVSDDITLYQGFIIYDGNTRNTVEGVSVTMDNSKTVISNQYGGVMFENVAQGMHTFVFSKNGYSTTTTTLNVVSGNTRTIEIFKPVTPTPTGAQTLTPTPIPTDFQGQPIVMPIGQPKSISDSVKYGLAKVFGITSLDSINLVFALIIILFPAVVGGVITNQSLAFVAGGMIGFVVALGLGLIPIWVFFAMVMFTVIYLILTTGNNF